MRYKRALEQAFNEHQKCAEEIINKATSDQPSDAKALGGLLTSNFALLGRTVALGFLTVVEAIELVGRR